jgi:hypothetical protein
MVETERGWRMAVNMNIELHTLLIDLLDVE